FHDKPACFSYYLCPMKLHLQSAHLYTISFSHKKLPLNLIGKVYLDSSSENYFSQLESIKQHFAASEIMHISTCNRCEYYIVSKQSITKKDVQKFFSEFYNTLSFEEKTKITEKLIFKKDENAVKYLMEVVSSLQSMVIGEREILTQVRNAYEKCQTLGLTGDLLRLVIKKVIETGKEVFARTDIAKNPVSVASLAARQLAQLSLPQNAKVTVIGSGVTMQTFLKYFHNPDYQYSFVSRKKENSRLLQAKYGGTFMNLDELKMKAYYPTDILLVCTASPTPVVNKEIYTKLFHQHSMPVIVDLSNPSDVEEEVKSQFLFEYIDIASLKKEAQYNLNKRKQSISHARQIIDEHLKEFMQIFKERCIENIISEIPGEIKEYKHKAINEVFRKKIDQLAPDQMQLVQEIVDYLEGKYNAVTYRKLKSILLQ
ncbi:MAG: glutamyl-tRNA reductase, partial [Bacteroidia bacterium]|nr:glutamyl-tRNA reductase [Bacteroidia bacterium]